MAAAQRKHLWLLVPALVAGSLLPKSGLAGPGARPARSRSAPSPRRPFRFPPGGVERLGADHSGQNLTGRKLSGARLTFADFHSARLAGADLSGADLEGAQLADADLTGADLRRARLRGATLFRADLSGARLEGADFRGALYDTNTRWPAGFDPRGKGALFIQNPRRSPLRAGAGSRGRACG